MTSMAIVGRPQPTLFRRPLSEIPIIEAGGMLAHVHLSDSNKAISGRGPIDFNEVFEALREIGYDGLHDP